MRRGRCAAGADRGAPRRRQRRAQPARRYLRAQHPMQPVVPAHAEPAAGRARRATDQRDRAPGRAVRRADAGRDPDVAVAAAEPGVVRAGAGRRWPAGLALAGRCAGRGDRPVRPGRRQHLHRLRCGRPELAVPGRG